ncbi:MAG: amidohydrolase family protein [Proteobacteria bacterium]|nr:amidohydrolase family protein [Pseudomonadota bacterium]
MKWVAIFSSLLWAAPSLAACTVLSGGMVYLEEGVEKGVTVVMDEGEIVGVGKGLRSLKLTMEAGEVTSAMWGGRLCAFVEVGGKHVVPGFVETMSQLGLIEISHENATKDADGGGDPVRAALRAADAYNPRSTLIGVQRVWGVTSAMTLPTGGLVSGVGAWVDLNGHSQAEAVQNSKAAMVANLHHGPSRADALLRLRELLDDALDYQRNRGSYERNQRRDYVGSRLDLIALGDVVNRKMPLVVKADRAADIEALLELKKEYGIKLVISGGAEAWLLAQELASAKVAVIINPLVYGPGNFQQIHARPDNGAILASAGVTVIISSFSTHNARKLRQVAGNAVRGGMDHHYAIQAITSNPAKVFSMRRHGLISAGAIGNLVVWDGDPLELSSRPETVFIRGEVISMENRQTELRDRYRELPGTPLPPLPLPEQ